MSPYTVTTGFYSEHVVYYGDSAFIAGLTLAKAQRDGATYGLNAVMVLGDGYDDESNGLDEEEQGFFDACFHAARKFKNRKKVCK
jgi:hypothetical protein